MKSFLIVKGEGLEPPGGQKSVTLRLGKEREKLAEQKSATKSKVS